ncbi:hypothetical protein MRB53_030570 [Persea americana]|uniref:Uncharacterized protein n=1 Tax=Persea americana TaxID=3435 RepID=A0ACC2KLY1_PERAE|nr:hypothetical protein MRB53_030570 [Persea americana]
MPGFFQTVQNAWDTDVSGTPLFIVVRKLSILKRRLIEWKKSQGDIPMKLSAAYLQLETLQLRLASDPQDLNIQEQERMARFELDIQDQSPDLSHITPHGVLTDGDALALMRPVTVTEIEDVVKSANPNKAPGPDGFNAHFFKEDQRVTPGSFCRSGSVPVSSKPDLSRVWSATSERMHPDSFSILNDSDRRCWTEH